jgi:DsbC/DsbD-like thiol-disulfide interchange protein
MIKKTVILLLLLQACIISLRAEDESKLVKVELISGKESVNPGDEFYVAARFKIAKHWHIYWINPGDAGLPTTIEWNLPEGIEVKEIYWPSPNKYKFGEFYNFGFGDDVIVPVRFAVKNFNAKSVRITANASWLVCREKCIPGNGSASIEINFDENTKINKKNKQLIDNALLGMPVKSDEWKFHAKLRDQFIELEIIAPDWFQNEIKNVDLFPFAEGTFSTEILKITKTSGSSYKLVIKLDQYRIADPKNFEAIINAGINWHKNKNNKNLYINIPITTN